MAASLFAEHNKAAWAGVRPAVNGTPIFLSGNANNSNLPLYTVPAGKTLLVFNNWFHLDIRAGVGLFGHFSVYTGGGLLVYSLDYVASGVGTGFPMGHQARFVPLEVPAAYTLNLVSPAANVTCYGGFEGLLVDPLTEG